MSYKKARLVIVGSGIVGASAAYHLTKLGWKDILVLDKGHPHDNLGSTSHAPGGVVPLSHSLQMTRFALYSSDLFSQLKPYRDDRHSYNPVGQMEIAISQERWVDLKRLHGEAKSFGLEAHLLSPTEMKAMVPILNHIMPILKTADPEFHKAYNGIFAFPVDGYPMLGETTINGLWTAIGSWITHSGGVGKSIAEWMTHGDTEWDMRQCNVNRFAAYQTTPTFTEAICNKNYREIYDIIHPRQELSAPRNVRLSPFL